MANIIGKPILIFYDIEGNPVEDETKADLARRLTIFDDGTVESEDYVIQEAEENTIVEEESSL